MRKRKSGLGLPIRILRAARGLTTRELAAGVGVTGGYVSMLERDMRVPSEEVMYGLAKALGVKWEVLAGMSDGGVDGDELKEALGL